jgi:hypothetical protein
VLGFLALAHYGPARAFTGSGIGMSALTANGKTPAMSQSPVTAKVHEALDIHRDLGPQITFHLQMGIYDLPDRIYLDIAQIVTLGVPVDRGRLQNFACRRSADAINIGESDFDALVLG